VVAERPVEPRVLLAHCRERLAPFKVPRRVELRDALPRSPLGKLLRSQLIAPAASDAQGTQVSDAEGDSA
jgi:acyl-CoA synthetase (AMP-forming)/AMP-acid ligase II